MSNNYMSAVNGHVTPISNGRFVDANKATSKPVNKTTSQITAHDKVKP